MTATFIGERLREQERALIVLEEEHDETQEHSLKVAEQQGRVNELIYLLKAELDAAQ
jgi:hypothetical protein